MGSLWKYGRPLIAAIALVAGSCGDDDGGPTGGGPADTTPPAVTAVTPIDGFHLEVTFDEDVLKESAERSRNYTIVEAAPPFGTSADEPSSAPGDTVHVSTASLKQDGRTVALSTIDFMNNLPFDITVSDVSDVHGNKMTTADVQTFAGTGTNDVTPPEIVFRSPGPGDTGVGTAQPLIVQFSEPVPFTSVVGGLSWVAGGSDVLWQPNSEDLLTYVFTPLQPLGTNASCMVTLDGVNDFALNTMPMTTWSFTTTPSVDTTPPSLVSTIPGNMATNVDVNTYLQLNFSEPIDHTAFEATLSPDAGDGIPVWSNGSRTVTFQPDEPLLDNTQYNLLIFPGAMRDLSGNGNTSSVNIRFTTGPSLAIGSIAGTVSGDANSDFAGDPTGGVVIAPDIPPFDVDDFDVYGSAVVGDNDTYAITNLPDGTYYPVSALDSNNDGNIDPDEGDAIGAFGIDLGAGDTIPDPVSIIGGSAQTNVDFQIYDFSAIVGTFSYDGVQPKDNFYTYIGVFDTTGFDPSSTPVTGTREFGTYDPTWSIGGFDGVPDGVFYVGAFIDVDFDGMYDLNEPAGLYGGLVPTPIVIARGSDALGVHITIEDPNGTSVLPPVAWRWTDGDRARWFERLSALVRRGLAAQPSP